MTGAFQSQLDLALVRRLQDNGAFNAVTVITTGTPAAVKATRPAVRDSTINGRGCSVPGNITPVAEANIANDPEAAALVLSAGWDVTLVPLDVTMANVLEESHRQELLAASGPVPRAFGDMLGYYFRFYEGLFGRACSAMHDPLAAALAVGGVKAAVAPVVHVDVDTTSGPGRGQTVCDMRGLYLDYPAQPGARCRVVLSLEDDFAPHLVETLLGHFEGAGTGGATAALARACSFT